MTVALGGASWRKVPQVGWTPFNAWSVLSDSSHSLLPPEGGRGLKKERSKTHTDTHMHTHTHTHAHIDTYTCTHADTHAHTHPGEVMGTGRVSTQAGMCARLPHGRVLPPGQASTCRKVTRLLLDRHA